MMGYIMTMPKGFEGEHVFKVDLIIADKLKELNKLIILGNS